MKFLVTGATGFIGNRLVSQLIENGHQVNVLVRKWGPENGFEMNGIKIFEGNLSDNHIINHAISGCDGVFHLAAYANIWSKDKNYAYKINVEGTRNILDASLQKGIKKVIFTSSAATLASSDGNNETDESTPYPEDYITDYEITKRQAEILCDDFNKVGLPVVTLHPTRVFGPGHLNKSNSVTILIKKYISGRWRIIPGSGLYIGNYVFIDDVVSAQILAFEKGAGGEHYITGGENLTFNRLFEIISEVSDFRVKMFHLPVFLMMGVAKFEWFMAETFGKMPLITPQWLKRYMQHRSVSSEKAKRELGYEITPVSQAIRKTLLWLEKER